MTTIRASVPLISSFTSVQHATSWYFERGLFRKCSKQKSSSKSDNLLPVEMRYCEEREVIHLVQTKQQWRYICLFRNLWKFYGSELLFLPPAHTQRWSSSMRKEKSNEIFTENLFWFIKNVCVCASNKAWRVGKQDEIVVFNFSDF